MKLFTILALFPALLLASPVTAAEPDEAKVKAKLEEAYAAAAKDDQGEVKRISESLKLPQPDVWFAGQFGDDKGAKIASFYADLDFGAELPKVFARIVEKGQSDVRVTAIKDPNDPNATGNQKEALAAMKNPVTLYSVRFIKPGEEAGMHLYSFVVIDGEVRFLGKMKG